MKGGNVSAFGAENTTKILFISEERDINLYFEETHNDSEDFDVNDEDNEAASNFSVHTDFNFRDNGVLLDKAEYLLSKSSIVNYQKGKQLYAQSMVFNDSFFNEISVGDYVEADFLSPDATTQHYSGTIVLKDKFQFEYQINFATGTRHIDMRYDVVGGN